MDLFIIVLEMINLNNDKKVRPTVTMIPQI